MNSFFSKIVVVKLPKHRRFNITPRYYDEEKENLEKRKKLIAQELGLSEAGDERAKREIDFRAKLQTSKVTSFNSQASRRTNFRLVVILAILLAICYAIYMNLDSVIATLSK